MSVISHLGAVLFGTQPEDVSRRRTLLFTAAVILLLTVARKGAPSLAFGVALSVYLILGGLWLRGQYTRYLAVAPTGPEPRAAGEPAAPPPLALPVARLRTYLALFGVAIALGSAYVVQVNRQQPVSGLLLAALVVAYFAIGGVLAVWRHNGTWVGRAGAILAALAVVLVVAGYLVLHEQDTHLLKIGVGMLAVGLLACWPVAVALLSERGTTFLADTEASPLRWLAMGVGFGGTLVIGVWLWFDSHSTFTILLVVGLAVLTVSVASSTRADIVLIIVGLAVMGFTPGDGGDPRPVAGKKHVLVAIGDSYMSGEGASIYFKDTDTAGKDTCRRAPSAWAVQAGQQPPFDGTLFLACSGAVTANIRTSNPEGSGLPGIFVQRGEGKTQLEQYADRLAADDFTPQLVVLSIGGNDAGFSTIGVMCLVPGNCADKGSWWTGGLAEVRASLDATFTQVREAFDGVPVVVTAYPDPIFRGRGDQAPATANDKLRSCSQVALRAEERAFIASFLEKLNDTVHDVARAHDFYYLAEMKDSLKDAGLQLCDPANHDRPGLNFIGLRSVSGLAEQRFNPANWSHNSLHPNERGHQAMLETFERWLAANPTLEEIAPHDTATPVVDLGDAGTRTTAAADTEFAPVCSPLDPNPSGCRSRGTHWAADETGKALIHSVRATQIVLIEALWWLGVLGFFGWRRRRWFTTPPVNLV